jgi:hypothetical protein
MRHLREHVRAVEIVDRPRQCLVGAIQARDEQHEVVVARFVFKHRAKLERDAVTNATAVATFEVVVVL